MVSLSPHKDPPTPSPADCKSRQSIPRKPVTGMRWLTVRKPLTGSPRGELRVASHRALAGKGGLTLPPNCSSSSSSLSLPPRAPRHLETSLEFLLEISISTIRHFFLPLYFYPPHPLNDGAHPSFTTEARVPCGPYEHISELHGTPMLAILQDIWSLGNPGASGKDHACQCRRHKRHRFNPWVGKIPWRRAWQPTPVFSPGESHGQRSLAGYSSWGHKESDTTKVSQPGFYDHTK